MERARFRWASYAVFDPIRTAGGLMGAGKSDSTTHVPEVRKGQGPPELDRAEFARRLRRRFFDPAFDDADAAIETIIDRAWDGYIDGRTAPRTRRAGHGFADRKSTRLNSSH